MNPANKTSTKLYNASVLSNEADKDIFNITFKVDGEFFFKPGQYVWVVLPGLTGNGEKDRSAFSIAGYSEDQKEISILFKRGKSNYKKNLMELRKGDAVKIIGASGSSLTFDKNYKQGLIFIAGGVGIAPFLSQIKYHTTVKSNTKIYLYYFSDYFSPKILNDLKELKKNNPSFIYTLGEHVFADSFKTFPEGKICVIGSQSFVDEVYRLLLGKGMRKRDIIFEQNYPSSHWLTMNYDLYSGSVDNFNPFREKTLEKFIPALMFLGSVFTVIAGFVFYLNNYSFSLHIVTIALLGIIFIYWKIGKNIMVVVNLLAGLCILVIIASLVLNQLGTFVLYWLSFVPVLIFIVLGRKGIVWNTIYLLLIYAVFIAKLTGIFPIEHDVVSLVNSVLAVTMVYVLVFINSRVDERRRVNLQKLVEKLDIFKESIESSTNHIVITDENAVILFANKAAQKITGYDLNEMRGNSPRLWGGEMDREFYENLWRNKVAGKPFDGEIINRRKDGSLYTAMVHISPIMDGEKILGYIGTEEDITQLKELNRLKDEFLSIASHELRTPMTAIKGFVSMILDGDYGMVKKEQKDPLLSIQTSTERLIHLVNDLLNLTRIEAGRLKISLESFDPAKNINEVVNSLIPIAEEKNLKLYVKNTQKCTIQADGDKLRQILVNLVGNSLKFTQKGEISISQRVDAGYAKFSVTDTGIGIDKKDQPKIFGKFVQIQSKLVGKPVGTGLGLYICKILVEKMGGKMWIEASSPGNGSTFSFTLPLVTNKIAKQVKQKIIEESEEHPDQKDLANT